MYIHNVVCKVPNLHTARRCFRIGDCFALSIMFSLAVRRTLESGSALLMELRARVWLENGYIVRWPMSAQSIAT